MWTARRVAHRIREKFGIPPELTPGMDVQRNLTLQKPMKRAKERDLKAIGRWLAEEWPAIPKKRVDEHAHIVLIDETGLFLNPLVHRPQPRRGTELLSRLKAAPKEKCKSLDC